MEYIKLSELTTVIKNVVNDVFSDTIWIIAEISELNENRSGHAYLELIEKDESFDRIVAKVRATIWGNLYRMMKSYFESVTGRNLSKGMKILLNVSVEFHELYGFTLNVKDIDPTYTLGDVEKQRKEIIQKLIDEGVMEMNKELEFPIVPQHIAVISSPNAAGYGDFINQINNNPYSYKIQTKLFPAVMQGESTEKSVIQAFENIYEHENEFDLVVIIRGGGSKTDLAWFDSYLMALNISQFPLPVLTGIGHERDQSIADMVAYEALKTPTAVAEYIIDKIAEFENLLNEYYLKIIEKTKSILQKENNKIQNISLKLIPVVKDKIDVQKIRIHNFTHQIEMLAKNKTFIEKNYLIQLSTKIQNVIQKKLNKEQYKLSLLQQQIGASVKINLMNHKHHLQLIENNLNLENPLNLLKKGYSITKHNGKIIKSIHDIEKGVIIETIVNDGGIISVVDEKKENKNSAPIDTKTV